MQVERAAAGLLGVQVDLPRLAQRVGLDEVALVVHVEAVVDGVVLELGDEPGDVDGGHGQPATATGSATCRRMPGDRRRACSRCSTTPPRAVRAALDGLDDWGRAGTRPGQYHSDLAADDAAVAVLDRRRARRAERGVRPARRRPRRSWSCSIPSTARTNASRGHPVVRHQPVRGRRRRARVAALVVNQAAGRASRRCGAAAPAVDGAAAARRRRAPRWATPIVGLSGYPPR